MRYAPFPLAPPPCSCASSLTPPPLQPFRAFEKDEGLSLRTGKMIYISLQVLSLIVALYKCSTMGLLPLTSVDWVDYLPEVVYKEVAVLPAL